MPHDIEVCSCSLAGHQKRIHILSDIEPICRMAWLDHTILTLVLNLGLLSLAALSMFILISSAKLPMDSRLRAIASGSVYGLVTGLVVIISIDGPPGATFNASAAPVLIVGYFSGPIGGVIVATCGAIARYSLGDPMAIGGAVSFYLYLLAALAFRRFTNKEIMTAARLAVLSIFATFCVFPSYVIGIPAATGITILASTWHILLVVNLVGTVLLGLAAIHIRAFTARQEEFDAILTCSPDGILTVDHMRCIRSLNPSAISLFDWSEEEIIGKDISVLVPDALQESHCALVDGFIKDDDLLFSEMTGFRIVDALKKDRTTFPVLISLAKIQTGPEPLIAVTVHDMSEIAEARKNLVKMTSALAMQLQESTNANEAKNRFLANMSHELRTPLNAIIGYASLIRTLGPDQMSVEKLDEYITDIQHGGESLLTLINNVIDISKIEEEASGLDISRHHVSEILNSVVTFLKVLADQREVRLKLNVDPDVTVLCDLQTTIQAFTNVLSNAIKYSPVGGEITVGTNRSEEGVVIAVEDDGPGVSEHVMERLGEPFLRGESPEVRETEGSGLGLALSMKFLERQNGRLEIARKSPNGTIASLHLPAEIMN